MDYYRNETSIHSQVFNNFEKAAPNEMDFNSICRACLSVTDHLQNIFRTCSAEVFLYCTSVQVNKHKHYWLVLKTPPYSNLQCVTYVKYIVSQVSENDGLPGLLCQACLDLVNRLYYFKQLVLRSDATLRQYGQTQVPNNNIILGFEAHKHKTLFNKTNAINFAINCC